MTQKPLAKPISGRSAYAPAGGPARSCSQPDASRSTTTLPIFWPTSTRALWFVRLYSNYVSACFLQGPASVPPCRKSCVKAAVPAVCWCLAYPEALQPEA